MTPTPEALHQADAPLAEAAPAPTMVDSVLTALVWLAAFAGLALSIAAR